MGAGSADKSLAGRLVYAMQVVEVLTFDEYMKDARFERKVPTDPGAVKRAYGDNIYRHGDDGAWLQADSRHSLADGNPTLGTSRWAPQLTPSSSDVGSPTSAASDRQSRRLCVTASEWISSTRARVTDADSHKTWSMRLSHVFETLDTGILAAEATGQVFRNFRNGG